VDVSPLSAVTPLNDVSAWEMGNLQLFMPRTLLFNVNSPPVAVWPAGGDI
jgi:hypothetical protein